MNVGFEDNRGKLVWTLPQDANQLLSQVEQSQQAQIKDLFDKSLGIVCFFLLQSFGDQRMSQHVEGVMNIITDLIMAATARKQQEQDRMD